MQGVTSMLQSLQTTLQLRTTLQACEPPCSLRTTLQADSLRGQGAATPSTTTPYDREQSWNIIGRATA